MPGRTNRGDTPAATRQKLLVKCCIKHKDASDSIHLMSRVKKEPNNGATTGRRAEMGSSEAKVDPEALFIDLDM